MLIRRSILLLFVLLSVALTQMPIRASAQATGTKAKAKSKDQLTFEVYQDKAGEYRWRLVSGEDKDREILATGGQGYKAKADCMHGVKSIQDGAADKLTFETYEDNAKQNRWHAKASNGQVVASSAAAYKTKSDCQKAIDAVKKEAAKATVEEVKEDKT